jgi:parallel beta-helix repeat protein
MRNLAVALLCLLAVGSVARADLKAVSPNVTSLANLPSIASGTLLGNSSGVCPGNTSGQTVAPCALTALPAIDASSAKVTISGQSVARTLAVRAVDTLNVADYGAVCDGSTDDATAIQSAVSAGAGKRVLIPATATSCVINSAISVPSNVEISGLGNPTIKAGVSGTIFTATSASGIYIHDLTLNGNSGVASSNPVINFTTVTNSVVDHVIINNPTQGIMLQVGSNSNKVSRVIETNSGQHGVDVDNSCDNQVLNNQFNGQTGFGIILANGACRNLVQGNSDTTSGIELVGITYASFDNKIIGNEARSTGDNCYSITGYRNIVEGNIGIGCQGNGITLYGSYNTVTGNTLLDNAQGFGGNPAWTSGIVVLQGFGGTGQYNTITGNFADDDQVSPTQRIGINAVSAQYSAWANGISITNGEYRYNGLNLYKATNSATSGASPPTCTSGTCSDGTVTWSYINTFMVTVQPDHNFALNNTVNRYVSTPYADTSSATHNSGFKCLAMGTANNSNTAADNQCQAAAAFSAGQGSNAAGVASIALGSSLTSSGTASFATGSSNVADGNYTQAGGHNSAVRGRLGASCFAGGQFATGGDAQACYFVLQGTGASASAIRVVAGGGAASGANCVNLPNNSGFELVIDVVAFDHTTVTKSASWNGWTGLMTRGANAASTSLSMNTTPTPITNGSFAPTIAATADTSNGCLNISVTPPGGNTDTINVVARALSVEVQ